MLSCRSSFPFAALISVALCSLQFVYAAKVRAPSETNVAFSKQSFLRRSFRLHNLESKKYTQEMTFEKKQLMRRLSSNVWEDHGSQIDGKNNGEKFGFSMALSDAGTVLVVGAPDNDDGGTNKGRVRVYQYLMSAWTESGDLPGQSNFDQFGRSVAINTNGNRFIGGSPDNNGGAADAGSARVYQYNISDPSKWSQVGQDLDGAAAGDRQWLGRVHARVASTSWADQVPGTQPIVCRTWAELGRPAGPGCCRRSLPRHHTS